MPNQYFSRKHRHIAYNFSLHLQSSVAIKTLEYIYVVCVRMCHKIKIQWTDRPLKVTSLQSRDSTEGYVRNLIRYLCSTFRVRTWFTPLFNIRHRLMWSVLTSSQNYVLAVGGRFLWYFLSVWRPKTTPIQYIQHRIFTYNRTLSFQM